MKIIRHTPNNTPFVDLGVGRPVPVGTYRAWARRYRRHLPKAEISRRLDDDTVWFLVRAGLVTRVSGARTTMNPSGQALALTVHGVIWVAELIERAAQFDFGGPKALTTVTYAEVVACEGTLRTVLRKAQLLDQHGNPGVELRAYLKEWPGHAETLKPDGVHCGRDILPLTFMRAVADGSLTELPYALAGIARVPNDLRLPRTYGRRFACAVRQGYLTQAGRPTIGGRHRAAAWLREARPTV